MFYLYIKSSFLVSLIDIHKIFISYTIFINLIIFLSFVNVFPRKRCRTWEVNWFISFCLKNSLLNKIKCILQLIQWDIITKNNCTNLLQQDLMRYIYPGSSPPELGVAFVAVFILYISVKHNLFCKPFKLFF